MTERKDENLDDPPTFLEPSLGHLSLVQSIGGLIPQKSRMVSPTLKIRKIQTR